MSEKEVRDAIYRLVSLMHGMDEIEKEHIHFARQWITSGAEIFRLEKPAIPDIHLVSYFIPIDLDTKQILLANHKKSGLWLPPGGHVELNENPLNTVKREANEELGVESELLFDTPIFLSVTKTVGETAGHTDVSLWYVLGLNADCPIDYDREEFNKVHWFSFDDLPYHRSDPHLKRFVKKLTQKISFDYAAVTRNSYETSVKEYAKNVIDLHPKAQGEKFKKMLPEHAKILDLGCGPGRDAKIFSDLGLQVVGVDYSLKMIEMAKQTASQAEFYEMDIEELKFPEESFDGVWASCSLLHIPKNRITSVLSKIYALLKSDGVLYLSVKQGTGEIVTQDQRYGGLEKFWSFFQEDELQDFLKIAGFTICDVTVVSAITNYQTHPLIKIFAKK